MRKIARGFSVIWTTVIIAGIALVGYFIFLHWYNHTKIEVVFPKGSEILEIDQTYEIEWKNYSGNDPLIVMLQTILPDGQVSYGVINKDLIGERNGTTTWKLSKVDTSYKYKVAIFSGKRVFEGESEGFFTIIKPQPKKATSTSTNL